MHPKLGIVVLLAREFILLVVGSYALALPVASIFATRWLADFASKTEIFWGVYAATVRFVARGRSDTGVQSGRASLANPVDNLRNE